MWLGDGHLLVPVSSYGEMGEGALWHLFNNGPNPVHEDTTLMT